MSETSPCDSAARDCGVLRYARAHRRFIVRTIGMLSLAASMLGCTSHSDSAWDWNRMQAQPKVTAYSDMPGSNALRLPPVGTLSRESASDDSARFAAVDLSRGKLRYDTFCAVCHGAGGSGESLVGSNMEGRRPPAFVRDTAVLSAEQTFAIVTEGFGRMPGFAAKVSAPDRWQIVAYIATLRPNTALGRQQ